MGVKEMLGIGTPENETVPPIVDGGDGSSTASDIVADATARRGPGRPRKNPSAGPPSPKAATLALSVEEINRLFKPKNFERFSTLYFDTRFAVTGFEGFRLTDEEKTDLAEQLAMLVKVMIRVDPKYIALGVFLSTYLGVMASKEMQWKLEKDKRKRGAK